MSSAPRVSDSLVTMVTWFDFQEFKDYHNSSMLIHQSFFSIFTYYRHTCNLLREFALLPLQVIVVISSGKIVETLSPYFTRNRFILGTQCKQKGNKQHKIHMPNTIPTRTCPACTMHPSACIWAHIGLTLSITQRRK